MSEFANNPPLLTLQDVLQMFAETSRQFQETDRQFKETDRQFKETDRQFKETDRKIQETDRLIKELRESEKETNRKFLETDRQFKATDRKLNKLEHLFTSQWGKLLESLVEGDLVPLLQARGIAINDTSTRLKGKLVTGGNYEFDILAHNGNEVVVIEVKTTLRPDDVKHFTHKLSLFKQWLPRYAANRVYGAMAWLNADAGAERMVEKQGLFSIRATGSSAAIMNNTNFTPHTW